MTCGLQESDIPHITRDIPKALEDLLGGLFGM
jgi:hypothetical protein